MEIMHGFTVNPLPNNKILDLKTFVLERLEKICKKKKREIAGYHHFLLLPQCFNSLPKDKLLTLTKLKEFAGDNFGLNENN